MRADGLHAMEQLLPQARSLGIEVRLHSAARSAFVKRYGDEVSV